jgi:NOL1/NOP2/fmu family ribosome biogenesis protein
MFRKTPAARRQWRPAAVMGCALRQDAILLSAARLLRPGGRLVYATCTFAAEENEAVIARFLRARPDFELLAPPQLPGFDPGRPDWIDRDLAAGLSLERCVRIWPHRAPGEGHFFAVLARGGASTPSSLPPAGGTPPPLLRRFWEQTMRSALPETGWAQYGEHLYLTPVGPEFWQGVRAARAGLRGGRIAHERLEPDHALALASADVLNTVAVSEAEALAWQGGQSLAGEGPDGWVLITLAGFGLGWGKRVGGVIKNHYPRHLRRA